MRNWRPIRTNHHPWRTPHFCGDATGRAEEPPFEALRAGCALDTMCDAVVGRLTALLARSVPLMPGLTELLEALRSLKHSHGGGLLHSPFSGGNNLRVAGIRTFQRTDVRGHGTPPKPAPDIYLTAAKQHCSAPDLPWFWRTATGYAPVQQAGCITVMVPNMDPATPEMEQLCRCIVPSLQGSYSSFGSGPVRPASQQASSHNFSAGRPFGGRPVFFMVSSSCSSKSANSFSSASFPLRPLCEALRTGAPAGAFLVPGTAQAGARPLKQRAPGRRKLLFQFSSPADSLRRADQYKQEHCRAGQTQQMEQKQRRSIFRQQTGQTPAAHQRQQAVSGAYRSRTHTHQAAFSPGHLPPSGARRMRRPPSCEAARHTFPAGRCSDRSAPTGTPRPTGRPHTLPDVVSNSFWAPFRFPPLYRICPCFPHRSVLHKTGSQAAGFCFENYSVMSAYWKSQ